MKDRNIHFFYNICDILLIETQPFLSGIKNCFCKELNWLCLEMGQKSAGM